MEMVLLRHLPGLRSHGDTTALKGEGHTNSISLTRSCYRLPELRNRGAKLHLPVESLNRTWPSELSLSQVKGIKSSEDQGNGLVLGQTPLACLFTLANLQPVLLNLWLVLLVHVILLPLRPPVDQLGLPDLGVPDCGLEQRMLINTKLQMTQLILS